MRKRIILFGLVLALLCGCGATPSAPEKDKLTIVATTYPIYLFASAVTEGVEGVDVERLNTGSVSCLHDYTLSMTDMKKIEQADVIALNGAGLEEFMEDALAYSKALVIDCSEEITLLENLSHHHVEEDEEEEDHDHEGHDHGHWDPHYWMSPQNARIMTKNLCSALSQFDLAHARNYEQNYLTLDVKLSILDQYLREDMLQANQNQKGLEVDGLITFHDGFQYFAHAYGLPLLEAIEEEAGSEASAKEIVEITRLVKEYDLPVIFTEFNGSDATAKAIARETGCRVVPLTMIMDDLEGQVDGDFQSDYLNGMVYNMRAIVSAFRESEDGK